jgi:arylsulfatase A-like enzyme
MTRRNLVLIVIDSLRTDQLHCYGAPDRIAPSLEELAARGVVFEQAITQGHATLTAMPALLSGCYPSQCGGFEMYTDQRPRLAAELKSLGYQAAAFVPNPYLTTASGYATGFDLFDECLRRSSRRAADVWNLLVRAINRLFGRWGIGIECPPSMDGRTITERAIQWVRRTEAPFFLWLHFMDAHMPYNLQRCSFLLPNGRGQRPYAYGFWRRCVRNPEGISQEELAILKGLYRAGITFVDGTIGRLCRALEKLGQLSSTTFVITADHGEEFVEHGLYGHRNHLYEESIHVPLIFAPATESSGRRVDAQVRLLDVAPTLIDLVGGTPPQAMQGVSLIPLMEGKGSDEHLLAISQTSPKREWRLSLRQPPWKLICQVDTGTLAIHHVELYHLGDDPAEQHNVAERFPEQAASMQGKLREHISGLDPATSVEAREVDPEVLERLKGLGYVDDL